MKPSSQGRPRRGAPSLAYVAGAAALAVALAASLTFCSSGAPGTRDDGGADADPPLTTPPAPVLNTLRFVGDPSVPFAVAPVQEAWVQRAPSAAYAPIAAAFATWNQADNLEAAVPPMCYTKTGGDSNPCYVCHSGPTPMNEWVDWDLQLEYAFSDVALTNHWTNLFEDRSADVAALSDGGIVAYVRVDNYAPLQAKLRALAETGAFRGYVPDLDLAAGFDDEGFAKDGSGWRALRYVPFPGSFWPTNGSTDDVFIRLPALYRQDLAHYKVNLAILEAVIKGDPAAAPDDLVFETEPLDETAVGVDLDGDGRLEPSVRELRGLPKAYVGDAAIVPTQRWAHPSDVEYLHSVRYVDPARPGLTAQRMKELRYARKVFFNDRFAIDAALAHELDEKELGRTPVYQGSRDFGWQSVWGWQYQGYIEDADGWLRLQTDEETRFCMGCHGAIGGTVDGTFTLPRKEPGLEGWRLQDLNGLHDRPSTGSTEGEILTYFRRVRGADELRANAEMLERFFVGDGVRVREDLVRRAGLGGDRDLAWLLVPTWQRALTLNKAYRAIVARQTFTRGRDATVLPVDRVHRTIEGNGSTALGDAEYVFQDHRIILDPRGPTASSR